MPDSQNVAMPIFLGQRRQPFKNRCKTEIPLVIEVKLKLMFVFMIPLVLLL